MSNVREILMALANLAGIDHFTPCQKDKLIKHGNNVASRLMDRKNDSAIVIFREGNERLDDVERVVRVQT